MWETETVTSQSFNGDKWGKKWLNLSSTSVFTLFYRLHVSNQREKMGNSYLSKVKLSEKESRRELTDVPAVTSSLDPTSEQRLTCFRDILDLVLHMSDEEWKAVSRDMAKEVTRPEFAAASTRILMVVLSAVFRYLLKPLSESLGVEAILEANDKLKRIESKSRKCSASDVFALRSPTDASDFICNFAQRIVTDIKDAMMEAIQSTASGPAGGSSPAGDRTSQLDNYSIACTNEICDHILALYLSEELNRPEGDKNAATFGKSHQEVHGIMRGLEQAVSNNRSSLGFNLKSLISELVSKMTEAIAPNCASLVPRAERSLSNQFMSKASQVVSDIILKTEQQMAASVLPKTGAPLCNETELNFLMELVRHSVSLENIQESAAAKLFLDKNTQVASDILMKRLSTFISTGLIKVKDSGSSTAVSMGSRDLDQVACDIVNRVVSGVALEIDVSDRENRLEAWIGEGPGSELPCVRRFSNVSRHHRNFCGDHRFIDGERTPRSSSRTGAFVSQNLFTVVRNHLKTFFTFLSKSSADDQRADASGAAQDHIVPIYIGEDGAVYELTDLSPDDMIRRRAHAITDAVANLILRNVPKSEDIGRSNSDTVLERGNCMLQSIQFPTDLVYRFVEESTKALVLDVLTAGVSPETEDQESRFVGKSSRRPNALALAHTLQNSGTNTNKTRLGFRFIVSRKKVVIRWPIKHFKKRKRYGPHVRRNQSTTSTAVKLYGSSHRKPPTSRVGFKTARRLLGRIGGFTSPR